MRHRLNSIFVLDLIVCCIVGYYYLLLSARAFPDLLLLVIRTVAQQKPFCRLARDLFVTFVTRLESAREG